MDEEEKDEQIAAKLSILCFALAPTLAKQMKQSRDMKYFAASAHVSKWRLEVDCPIYPPIQFPTPGWRFKMKAASLPGRLVRSSQVCSSANVFRAFPRQRHGLQASARHSSTISDPPVAAPQIDFAQMSRNPDARQLHGRVVPASQIGRAHV